MQHNNRSPFHDQPIHDGRYPPFPISPGQFQYQPPAPNIQPRPYSRLILIGLIILYIAFLGSFFVSSAPTLTPITDFIGRLGISLMWGLLASILIMDWRGYTSLNGLVNWQRMQKSLRFCMWCAHIFLCMVFLGIYLTQKALSYFRPSQQALIAQGQVPPTSWRPRIGLIVGTFVTLFAFFIYSGSASGSGNTALLSTNTTVVSSTPTNVVGAKPYIAPTQMPTQATLKPTATPRLIPTPTPKPQPTQPPTPTPTPKPQPTPTPVPCVAVYNNPWCYNFNPGNLIYNPPANFCAYFHCIKSFWEPDDPGDGYVVECADSLYSQSGGERGACSYHGGVSQPLYSH